MTEEYEKDAKQPEGRGRRMVLAGRLKSREGGVIQIDLIDGLTVNVMEDDCKVVRETTDAVTQRAVVVLELQGDKPITATFQPHLYHVLSRAGEVPFPFSGAADVPPDQFDMAGSLAQLVGGGGPGGGFNQESLGETNVRTRLWTGGSANDGKKLDRTEDQAFLT